MEKPLKIIIIILALTAVGLGYLISQRMISPDTTSQPPPLVSRTSVPTPPGASLTPHALPSGVPSLSHTPTPVPSGVSRPSSFTADEALMLKPPPLAVKGSKDEISYYFSTVERLAKQTDTIKLGSDCYANPLVVRVKQGYQLKVMNEDMRTHALNFDGSAIHTIPSKGTETITAKFSRGPGVYVYVCDLASPNTKIAGVLTITP